MKLNNPNKTQLKNIVNLITIAFENGPFFQFLESYTKKKTKKLWIKYYIYDDFYKKEFYVTSKNIEGVGILINENKINKLKKIRLYSIYGLKNMKKLSNITNQLDINFDEVCKDFKYYLDFLAVDPKLQGKVLRTRIVNEMMSDIEKNKDNSKLFVDTGSLDAIKFYKKNKFKLLKGFYFNKKFTQYVLVRNN
jgi:ribosomal protein S18 acetylase RimI-like enzyme